MTKYGYARVSSDTQDYAAQVEALRAAGCKKIYSEKASGARNDRAELAKLMKRLFPCDVLVVTRLDRLAAPPATCSTCWTPSSSMVPGSGRSRIPGPTSRPRMASSC